MKISETIQNLKVYVPGKSEEEVQREWGVERVVKLGSNESAHGPSSKVQQAIADALPSLNRYPDPQGFKLKQALSKHFGKEPKCFAVGNGSNEIIDLLIRIFCEPGSKDQILTSETSFVAYRVCAQGARVSTLSVPPTAEGQIDLKKIADLALEHKPRVIFLDNPNNPTGTYLNQQELKEFLNQIESLTDTLIVSDEAYFSYVTAQDYPQTLDLQKQYKNFLVLRTFSKAYGMAGLRLGVAIGDPFVISLIDKLRNPFNVNTLAQVAAIAALEDKEYLETVVKENTEQRQQLEEALDERSIERYPSQCNFILMDLKQDASSTAKLFLKRGVVVRPVKVYGFTTALRVTVGTPEENQLFLKSLDEVIAECS